MLSSTYVLPFIRVFTSLLLPADIPCLVLQVRTSACQARWAVGLEPSLPGTMSVQFLCFYDKNILPSRAGANRCHLPADHSVSRSLVVSALDLQPTLTTIITYYALRVFSGMSGLCCESATPTPHTHRTSGFRPPHVPGRAKQNNLPPWPYPCTYDLPAQKPRNRSLLINQRKTNRRAMHVLSDGKPPPALRSESDSPSSASSSISLIHPAAISISSKILDRIPHRPVCPRQSW